MKLYLASKSPQRMELLRRHGVDFTVAKQDAPEDGVSGTPREIVMELARRKAEAVAPSIDSGLVLGADTLVFLDGEVLGKPNDAEDAVRMLSLLSGRVHEVFTGLCVMDALTGEEKLDAVRTGVTFRAISQDEIDAYVKTGDPMSRAGAYGIQGSAGAFVKALDGSYENVMGLPVEEALRLISEFSCLEE